MYDLKKQDFSNVNMSTVLSLQKHHNENVKSVLNEVEVVDAFIKNFSIGLFTTFLTQVGGESIEKKLSHIEPSLSTSSKGKILRSKSLRRFLHMSTSERRMSSSQSPTVNTLMENKITASLKETSSTVVEKRIQKIKQIIIKLLSKIEKHPLGALLIESDMSAKTKTIYGNLKMNFLPSTPILKPSSSFSNESPTLSPNRSELLKELNMIEEQQNKFNIHHNVGNSENHV